MIGTEMKVKPLAETSAVLHGMRVKVLRKSRRTSTLTVEVLESRGCYQVGDTIHMQQYELEKQP